jgi:hypothetical protein
MWAMIEKLRMRETGTSVIKVKFRKKQESLIYFKVNRQNFVVSSIYCGQFSDYSFCTESLYYNRDKYINKNDMNDNIQQQRSADRVEISIHLDSELLDQIKHLTNDPSRIIETAIKQWLRNERDIDDDLSLALRRNPPVPPKGEWND